MDSRENYIKSVITDMMVKWGIGVDYRPSEVFTKPQPVSYLNSNGQGLRADLIALYNVESSLSYQDGFKDGQQEGEQNALTRHYADRDD